MEKLPSANKRALGESLADDRAIAKLKLAQQDARDAMKRYNKLLRRAAYEEQIVERFSAAIDDALEGRLIIRIPPALPARHHKGTPEEAVLVISDAHVWKIVKPGQTLGFGCYNPKVYMDRLYHLEQTVMRLLTENVANPITKLHVLLLGDLVEGQLQHSAEMPLRGLTADQVILGTWAFYQFLARISRVVEIVVRGIGGNHSRWANLRKVPTDNSYSNLDFILVNQLAQLFAVAGPKNVTFKLDECAFQVFDICGWTFKIGHGDHLKGGDRALHIPAHAIGREVNATTQRYAAKRALIKHGLASGKASDVWPPDYYIVGDKHRHLSTSTATGRYLINGAWFESDNYALRENFIPCRPFQLFFGVHPRMGKSWHYELHLDIAPSVPLQYDLPERIREKVDEFCP